MRVGLGFDVHAFDPTRPLILAGVSIEGSEGLAGHSDADVVCHAIGDALLGAVGRGDLGEWFPSTDEWKDSSSVELLKIVFAGLSAEGWELVNIDATVIAQRPRLSPHMPAMKESLAAALGVDADRISVKATSTDGVGAIGRGEGIAAMAVAALRRRPT